MPKLSLYCIMQVKKYNKALCLTTIITNPQIVYRPMMAFDPLVLSQLNW